MIDTSWAVTVARPSSRRDGSRAPGDEEGVDGDDARVGDDQRVDVDGGEPRTVPAPERVEGDDEVDERRDGPRPLTTEAGEDVGTGDLVHQRGRGIRIER